MDGEALLAGLNESQLAAVTATGGPVAVLAGAGSGKTRVLTRRIAWRVATAETDPGRVLALTFTRKAADELRHRLRSLGLRDDVAGGTFHSIALLQLRQRWAERGIDPPRLLDRKFRFVSRLLSEVRTAAGIRARIDARDVVTEIDWARARMVDGPGYPSAAAAAGRTPPLAAEQIGELLTRYQQEKQRRRVVDFDDLLMLAARDLRREPTYAEAIRWRYRHLYVDELQDVNPLQYELLSQWRGDRPDLFVVGDPNQAIYGWNGADPQLLDRFVDREPGATVIELRDNYRSTPQVLAVAATIKATSGGELVADRSDGPTPTLTAHTDDRAEAEAIATKAVETHAVAGSWADQAVLVRTNAQLVLIEQVLADAGVPTRLRGGAGPLSTSEVRTELDLLSRPDANIAAAVADLDQRLIDADASANTTVAEIERRANLAAFTRLVHDYLAADPDPTGPGLQAWIGTLEAGDVGADGDAVELTTFHGAKGLEWEVVHVAGLEHGFVPIAYATTGAQLAEEKRLLYVAVTRARTELHLSWAAERTFGAKLVTRQPSSHLAPLGEAITRLGVGPTHRVDWRVQIERSRQSLNRGLAASGKQPNANANVNGASSDSIYLALTEWRRVKAKAADVPAHAVFTDQTLRSIATSCPRTLTHLASVPGMRPAKLHRFGDEVLQIVAETGQ